MIVDDLKILTMAKGLAHHSSARQTLIAENIANADTVNYRARDVTAFDKVYTGPGGPAESPVARTQALPFVAKATRPEHIGYQQTVRPIDGLPDLGVRESARRGTDSPNGNNVSLEDQMARSAEAKIGHDMALGVLRKTMDILRLSIGRK